MAVKSDPESWESPAAAGSVVLRQWELAAGDARPGGQFAEPWRGGPYRVTSSRRATAARRWARLAEGLEALVVGADGRMSWGRWAGIRARPRDGSCKGHGTWTAGPTRPGA